MISNTARIARQSNEREAGRVDAAIAPDDVKIASAMI
jgi:hypothetical protein